MRNSRCMCAGIADSGAETGPATNPLPGVGFGAPAGGGDQVADQATALSSSAGTPRSSTCRTTLNLRFAPLLDWKDSISTHSSTR